MTRDDIIRHPLLSDAAKILHEFELEAHVELAIDLLGFGPHEDAIMEAPVVERAARAIVLQVNFQIQRGTAADVYTSKSVDSARFEYRPGSVSEAARLLAHEVLHVIAPVPMGGFATVVRSLR